MRLSLEGGAAGLAWNPSFADDAGVHTARGLLNYLMYQLEAGVCCPTTMTFAAVPALAQSAVGAWWAPRLAAMRYDGRDVPAADKAGVTVGMSSAPPPLRSNSRSLPLEVGEIVG